ncbi:hypothetical protein LDO32_15340 [Luteimonas sp. Y-2-2-4F]|nr:hypothetical protein [Luteimonas sp. Y-2-2-4F]MCD9033100.1 hypothetical protein [Luteimonas sp. Y-2-2-4F]
MVNIEAIAGPDRVEAFFADPAFRAAFARLDEVAASAFHVYRLDELVLPAGAGAAR